MTITVCNRKRLDDWIKRELPEYEINRYSVNSVVMRYCLVKKTNNWFSLFPKKFGEITNNFSTFHCSDTKLAEKLDNECPVIKEIIIEHGYSMLDKGRTKSS